MTIINNLWCAMLLKCMSDLQDTNKFIKKTSDDYKNK